MHILSRLLFGRQLFDKSDDGGGGGSDAPALTPPAPSDRSTGDRPQAIPMNEGSEPAPEPTPTPDAGKPTENGEASGLDELRKSIKETSKALPKKEKMDQTIPYFDEEEGDEPTGSDDQPAAADEPDGDQPKADAPDGAEEGDPQEKYYDPQVHAEGKDVYPNAYNSRQDAEFGLAAKLDRYEELANDLSEFDSEVGSTVPANIQQQIDSYKDVTTLSEASDDEIRDFIVNMDMAIKSIDEKKKNVSQRYEQTQKVSKVSEQYEKAQKQASEASKEIGLDRKINELSENATFEDVLQMADELIAQKIEPIDAEISEMENNTKYAKEHGQQAWLQKIRDLENKKSDLQGQLKNDRKALIEFNDARLEKQKLEEAKPVKLTDAQRIQKMDDVYSSWADDRSQGQFALEMFDAPTTEPIAHFRKFAFAPANRNKFDLTTKAGWDNMHSHWKQTMAERFNSQQQQAQKKQSKKKESSVDEPIPQPPIKTGNGQPVQGTHSEIQKARERIRQNSRQLHRR